MDECPVGKVFNLSRENRLFWTVFEQALPYVVAGESGYRLRPILDMFAEFRVPEELRQYWLEKTAIVVGVLADLRAQKIAEMTRDR